MYSLVIVNFGDPCDIIRLTRELESLVKDRTIEFIIVDNFLNISFTEQLERSLSEDVILYKSEQNLGFGLACNTGVELASGDYLLLINPDVYITKDSLIQFILRNNALHSAEDVGVTGVNVIGYNDERTVVGSVFPGVMDLFFGLVGWNRVFIYTFSDMDMRRVDQVIGAFFCVSRKVWDHFNGFDEQFFVYYEELDFCYRLNRSGLKNYVFSDIFIRHANGKASKNAGMQRALFQLRSKRLYFRKHFKNYWVLVEIVVVLELIIRLILLGRIEKLMSSFNYIWKK